MRTLILLIATSFFFISNSAFAFTTGWDKYTKHFDLSNLDAFELKSDQEWGQTFQITYGDESEVSLDQITVWLFRANNANNKTITASIRSSWNGAAIWQSTIQANTIEKDTGADQSELHEAVTFYGTSAQLSTGSQYYLRLDTTASEKIYVHVDPNSSYSPGNLINKDGNSESGKDMLFAIPEPSTALLVGLGLFGISLRGRSNH